MTFICPKCTAAIEQPQTDLPSDGVATKCPSCNARVQLIRVSFAKMAYFKAGSKSCAYCGNQLGHTLHCQACRAVYPDFVIAADPAVLRRQARDQRKQRMFSSFQGLDFSLPSFNTDKKENTKQTYTPQRVEKNKAAGAAKLSASRLPKLVAALIIIAIIAGGGYTAYARHKAEQAYMGRYFKALYGIMTGADMTLKVSTKAATDWKAAQEAGKGYVYRLSADEETRLIKVKSEVDKFVTQLTPPSDKFQQSKESLLALNKQYSQIHNLAITPPSTLPAFNEALTASTAQLTNTSKSLRSSLDEDMKAELLRAKQTYKVLQDF